MPRMHHLKPKPFGLVKETGQTLLQKSSLPRGKGGEDPIPGPSQIFPGLLPKTPLFGQAFELREMGQSEKEFFLPSLQ